jgi:hypothetical protein
MARDEDRPTIDSRASSPRASQRATYQFHNLATDAQSTHGTLANALVQMNAVVGARDEWVILRISNEPGIAPQRMARGRGPTIPRRRAKPK